MKTAIKCAGIGTTVTLFVTMMLVAFLEFSQKSLLAVGCSILVFFAINLAVLMLTRRRSVKTRAISLAASNTAAVTALVLLLAFVF